MCVSERTLLPVILPARKAEFPNRLGFYLGRVLTALGIPAAMVATECSFLERVRIGKTVSRRILGVMNDFAFMADRALREEPPLDSALWLAQSPSSVIDWSSADRATCAAFEVEFFETGI